MKFQKLIKTLCLLTALMMLLVSCSGGAPAATDSGGDGAAETADGGDSGDSGSSGKTTMTKRALVDQATYDPFRTNDLNDQIAHYQIFESLMREEPDGSVVPALCTEYEFNEAGDEITFKIRQDVKFHNGDVMTADDVVFSMNTAIQSSFTSKMTSTMEEMVKVDDETVVLKLKHAFAPILSCLVNASCSIVPQAVYEADPDGFGLNPVGTGPYMLGEVKSGEKVVFNAFPDYHRGEAAIKELVCRIIPDDAAALMAFESGELDMMQPSQAYTDRQAIIDNPNFVYYEAPQAVYFLVGFNNANGIFADEKLRQALAYATDRDELIMGAVNGMASPTYAPMVPSVAQYPEGFQTREYDLDKAKELLAEAGYPDGFEVTMRVIGAANYTKPAEVLQAQYKKIGVDLKIEPMERSTWFDVVYAGGDYEITFYAIAISVVDADFAAYPHFHSSEANGQGANFSNCVIPELDVLLEAGRLESDEAVRKDIYREVCEIIDEHAVTIPCYTGLRTMAADKDLKGMFADPMMRYYTYNYSW